MHPAFRRQGYGRRLINLCESASGAPLAPVAPVSPLGRHLFG
ncbi:MAG: GNAT family N-acetyltransferase [Gammaproteobacteria bacterium]